MEGLYFASLLGALALIIGLVCLVIGKIPLTPIVGRQVPTLILVIGVSVILVASSLVTEIESNNANNAALPVNENATVEDTVKQILREASGDNNGVADLFFLPAQETIPSRLNVTYQYKPINDKKDDIKKELGVILSPKLKQMYDAIPELDEVTFLVQFPVEDNYGNISWSKGASFTATREIIGAINWSNFDEAKLLDIAKNVLVREN